MSLFPFCSSQKGVKLLCSQILEHLTHSQYFRHLQHPMSHLTAHNINAQHSTFNHTGRDLIQNICYNVPVTSAPSSRQGPQPLSFNDTPIDLLWSYFTSRNNDLEHVGKLLGVNYGDINMM